MLSVRDCRKGGRELEFLRVSCYDDEFGTLSYSWLRLEIIIIVQLTKWGWDGKRHANEINI